MYMSVSSCVCVCVCVCVRVYVCMCVSHVDLSLLPECLALTVLFCFVFVRMYVHGIRVRVLCTECYYFV